MINQERLIATFLDLVRIDSPSGEEEKVGQYVTTRLRSLGFRVEMDQAGNVIGHHGDESRVNLLLNAHLDNVAPCRGVHAVIENDVIRSDGTTVLGADDKAGVAAILEALQSMGADPDGLPLEVVFTAKEELGLAGVKALATDTLHAKMGIVVDYGTPLETVVVAAPAQDSLEATIIGRSAHAGLTPELGISAIVVASRAIARMPLGRIDDETTANVGTIQGGTARNIVPEEVRLVAEARSHDEAKLQRQTQAMIVPLEEEAHAFGARAEIKLQRLYPSFLLAENQPVLLLAQRAASRIGLNLKPRRTGGGSDANIFNARGIPSAILSAGYWDAHTTREQITVADLVKVAELLHSVLSLVKEDPDR